MSLGLLLGCLRELSRYAIKQEKKRRNRENLVQQQRELQNQNQNVLRELHPSYQMSGSYSGRNQEFENEIPPPYQPHNKNGTFAIPMSDGPNNPL